MGLLELRGISKAFGGLQAVKDVTMDLQEGSITGLIGPNGSGKTTLINLITRLYREDSGQIFFDGENLERLKPAALVRKGVNRTFQVLRLFNNLSVFDNVRIGRHTQLRSSTLECAAYWLKGVQAEEEQGRLEALRILKMLGIAHLSGVWARNLSTGHARLVEIARALGSRPRLLCLDEPASGLNSAEKEQLRVVLLKINKDLGLSLLVVEHDMSLVMSLCQRIVVMNEGGKLAEGTPEEIRSNPDVIRAYLG